MTTRQVLAIMKKRLWMVVAIITLFVSTAVILCLFVLTPKYEAEAQVLVNQKDGYSWDQTENELRLINTYNVLITSPAILTKVRERLHLVQTEEQLLKQITVSNENESKVINIHVLDEQQEQAVVIANTIADVFKQEVPKLMAVDHITILSPAQLESAARPAEPNIYLYALLAFVVGSLLAVGTVLLLEALDTTISNEFQIEEIFELPVVGMIGTMKRGR